jgi:hypothetical protein
MKKLILIGLVAIGIGAAGSTAHAGGISFGLAFVRPPGLPAFLPAPPIPVPQITVGSERPAVVYNAPVVCQPPVVCAPPVVMCQPPRCEVRVPYHYEVRREPVRREFVHADRDGRRRW